MKIQGLTVNNIKNLFVELEQKSSIGIGGLSGSGKSTFCATLYEESVRRIISVLPKSEYKFLFPDHLNSNPSASSIEDIPLMFYLRKNGFASNPRSTLGTHSGLFKRIRIQLADKYKKTSEFFSFNNSIMWCPNCKGRGSTSGVECKVCGGSRYSSDIMEYTLSISGNDINLIDINKMTMLELYDNVDAFIFNDVERKIIDNLIKLGLPYLSLNRIMSTLSGGETIRVFLSEFMASCEGALLVLDEISTGLDKLSLMQVLKELTILSKKNQVWFIDHSDMVLYSSDKQIYFGPGSGDNGGKIVNESPRPSPVFPEKNNKNNSEWYHFKKLIKRNININTLEIPKGKITTITGESGCGKSTLVNDCIIPYFHKNYKSVSLIIIGQDRNQSITSKSTIASFLDIKKYLKKYDETYHSLNLLKACEAFKKDKHINLVLKMLVDLGLGYLTLDRKVQSLSTGEFQCIHLVSKIVELEKKEMVIFLDEPSKGLSQNILNLFMGKLQSILDEYNATIIIIEHNGYVLKCSDYVIDFGKRINDTVTSIDVLSCQEWEESQVECTLTQIKVSGMSDIQKSGIVNITEDVDHLFEEYENSFKGGILKNFSSTAQWIYKDYNVKQVKPVITVDFENRLYSENTFLFEVASIINSIISLGKTEQIGLFDFYNPDNLCECCKGTGRIETYNYESMIADENVGFWEGMLHTNVMEELKRYNYSKIKFLFKEIKKESGYDLNKPLKEMTESEKNIFLYGYWKNTFYDPNKKTQRRWYGVLHLIAKYIRGSALNEYKLVIKDTARKITCPICEGMLLNHNLKIDFSFGSLFDALNKPLKNNKTIFNTIPQIQKLVEIIGDDYSLMNDVSLLPYQDQVRIKIFELSYAKFYGFEIVLKNLAPYYSFVSNELNNIAQKNRVILLDWDGIKETKEKLLCDLAKHKVKRNSFAYEILGYKKISTAINAVKKKNSCSFCHGTGMLCEESIFEGVDVTKTPCMSCGKTGINDEGLNSQIEGIKVKTWTLGTFADINSNLPANILDIKLYSKISDLNKRQLNSLIVFLGEK